MIIITIDVLILLMEISNVTCVFNTYSYGDHNSQLGYYDMSFVDTDNTFYSTLDRL